MEKNNQEAVMEIASCSNPKADAYICKNCERNRVSDDSAAFNIKRNIGSINHICEGYINIKTKAFFS